MLNYEQFLLTEAKNTHSTHLEDLVLDGKSEADKLVVALDDILGKFKSNVKSAEFGVTVKYDGAPAIFFGYNEGKFFVGSKSIFNKVPKINYTNEDIEANHKGGLAEKLVYGLKHLKAICPNNGEVYQGDLMFTKGDLGSINKDGIDYVTCHPNTILYATPKDSKLSKKWLSSEIGLVVHTRYTGATLETMNASFGVSRDEFKNSGSVWLDDAYYKSFDGVLSFTSKETKEYETVLKQIKQGVGKISGNTFKVLSNELYLMINTYNNTYIRNGVVVNPTKMAQGLITYIEEKFQKEIDKRKSEKGKKTQTDKRDALLAVMPKEKELANVYNLQNNVVKIKQLVMSKLDMIGSLSTFVVNQNGEISVVGQEGYVGANLPGINGVKLVDRPNFSFNNFSPTIKKGFEIAAR